MSVIKKYYTSINSWAWVSDYNWVGNQGSNVRPMSMIKLFCDNFGKVCVTFAEKQYGIEVRGGTW